MTDKPGIPTETQPRGATRNSGDTPESGAMGGNRNHALPDTSGPAFGKRGT
jgi:hypothetical protein